MRIFLASFLLLCTCNLTFAQTKKNEFDFVNYLIGKELYEDAEFVLTQLAKQNSDPNIQDSSHFLLGQINFSQKRLSTAEFHFDLVGNRIETLYTPAVFYGALSSSYLKNYAAATSKLKSLRNSDNNIYQLKYLELASINLLGRDFTGYDSISQLLDSTNYLIGPTAQNLEFNKNKLLSIKGKSSFKAGLLSALVPGAGRMYVEKPGQGIYQLIIAALLGLQTWEGYKKDGVRSARFIIYGTLFTSFYIANIWGSALGVKIYKNEINKTVDNAILMDMHIPLRKIFR